MGERDNNELGKERMGLEGQSIEELRTRVAVGSQLIQMLRADGDVGAQKAIGILQEQQRQVNEVLVRKIKEAREARGEPEPEPVVVGMKAVKLTARAMGR